MQRHCGNVGRAVTCLQEELDLISGPGAEGPAGFGPDMKFENPLKKFLLDYFGKQVEIPQQI